MIKVKNPNNAMPISRMSNVIQNGHMMKASPWLLQLSAFYLLNAFLCPIPLLPHGGQGVIFAV